METFSIHISTHPVLDDINDPPSPLCSSLLFNNVAPKLRVLEISPAFQMNPSAPWLSNLQVLILSSTKSVTSILTILHHTPRLERLHLLPKSILAVDEIIDTSPVHLPHLQLLQIGYTRPSEAVPILEHIIPSTTCLLSMERRHSTRRLNDPKAEKLHGAVLRWMSTYCTSDGMLKHIILETYSSGSQEVFLWIRGPNLEAERRDDVKTTLNVDIPLDLDTSFIQPLIESSLFSSVTKLHLTSFIYHRDKLLQLLQTFSAVTELVLDPGW
ncbi:hypothetical protein CPC08DRAFT_714716 [Agrocybe pediades]|nr:hypothetical protein CPC08DRAFT_714716 [Agrocybe pediades]